MLVIKKKSFKIPTGFLIIVIFIPWGNSGHGVFTEPRPLFVQDTSAAEQPPRHRAPPLNGNALSRPSVDPAGRFGHPKSAYGLN